MKTLMHFPFSNFDYMHKPLLYDDISYPTVEHFFHAMKNEDEAYRIMVANAKTPGIAKHMGRTVTLRPDWAEVRESVMLFALLHKFAKGTHWRKELDDTKPLGIVEWNTWHDNIWGQCLCDRCIDTTGRNLLGRALMLIRDHELPAMEFTFSGVAYANPDIEVVEDEVWMQNYL